ncbi:MAG: tRNA 2-thiocytidine(32) synthetase TtcA [Firmicutes bacterium]|nr:tRNA 2-thiocytidine(32) synthetase TtcA [Bacillota bacterium]
MKQIEGKVRKALHEYKMLESGDKIAVGLSGGKDSLVLLTALSKVAKYNPIPYDLVAISIDMHNGATDFSKITAYCNGLGVEHKIVNSQIAELLFEVRKEKNPCSLCAKMRRGALNAAAKELGCTKVALGHHADDLTETLFLSLIYEGRISTFSAVTYLNKVDITVIRPLILVTEAETIKASKSLPVLHNPCPANKHTEREYVKQLLNGIEKKSRGAKLRMHRAIIDKERTNVFVNTYKDVDNE